MNKRNYLFPMVVLLVFLVVLRSLVFSRLMLVDFKTALVDITAVNSFKDQLIALQQLGGQLNQPANSVFETKNISYEKEEFERLKNSFISQYDLVKNSFEKIGGVFQENEEVRREINQLQSSIEQMSQNALLVFESLEKRETGQAGIYMAKMDRRFGELNDVFAEIFIHLNKVQSQQLNNQALSMHELQIWQIAFSIIVLGVLTTLLIFAFQFSKLLQTQVSEKQDLLVDIQNKNDELQKILRLNSSLNQILDRYAIISKTDASGKITFANENFINISGYSREELMGQNHRMLKSDYHNPDFFKSIWKAISGGNVWQGAIKNKNKNGQYYWVDSTIGPVFDETGKITEYMSVRYDITHKKMAEQNLIENQRMDSIGKLAAGIAHDFNNLLGGILGYTSLLKDKLANQPQLFSKLEIIERSALRGAELTKQMLGFARKGKYEKKIINLNQLIEEARNLLYRSIDKSIVIKSSLDPRIGLISGDSGQLLQVLVNLGVNSRDAMPEGGEIIFETTNVVVQDEYAKIHPDLTPGNYVKLLVSDTGQGIPKEIISKIFDPFFTTKEVGKGTGLGLAMVHGIVKNHEGAVIVYSEENRGTRFNLYFPIANQQNVSQEKNEDKILPQINLENRQVLAVDDEEMMRELVGEILENTKAKVDFAKNGQEALERVQNEKYHLVILDVVMPVMDGTRAFRQIRKNFPDLPVVFASGYAENEEIATLRKVGPTHFIQKPYHKVDLIKLIKEVLE